MGKKSSGNVSAGLHSNVNKSVRREMRSLYLESGERLLNQRRAFENGKRVMVTIENPNKNETNRQYIRVPANQIWKKQSG